MEIKKLDSCPPKDKGLLVKVTEMGNIIEVQYMSRRNNKQTILMLPGGDTYCDLSTGEIKECIQHETRADQKKSLYRTFKTVRGLINSNVTDVRNVKWITLTYKENMTDSVRLYKDFEKFNKKFQRYIKKLGYDKAEYIVMMEPQGRGAWHCHLLYIFDNKAPFIANDEIARMWGQGFTKTKKLDNVDNVGAYLTAYLGDMDMTDMLDNTTDFNIGNDVMGQDLKVVEVDNEKKYFVKGGRLKLYPAKFNMYRCSRGVKRPIETLESQEWAEKKVSGATLTYEKTVLLSDQENNFESIINTKQYNIIRQKGQYLHKN